jgi:hypothetical protein
MKYMKSLALLVAAAAALMAFAGTASADSVTSPTGTTYTSTIQTAAEGHTVLDNPIAKIECASTTEGKVEGHGAGKEVAGKFSSFTFSNCTDGWHVTITLLGGWVIHWGSGYFGIYRSTGLQIVATRFGVECRYQTSNTNLGTVTGGSPATVDVSASIPFHSGSAFCGSGATAWTGSYKVNTPSSLFVDNN